MAVRAGLIRDGDPLDQIETKDCPVMWEDLVDFAQGVVELCASIGDEYVEEHNDHCAGAHQGDLRSDLRNPPVSEKAPVTYAPRDRIDAFEELANNFVREVLGLPWAMMTDESALSDFSGCGLDGRDDLAGLDDEAHRAFWDEWVVERVCRRYRIEAFPVAISIVQLLERIERAAQLQ